MKWAPTFSSIYYEQVALLHPPNRLASDETVGFLPKHVPYIYKDHIGKIHLRSSRYGDRQGLRARIPSLCSLKAITHATGSRIERTRSRWNADTEYYPVGMKTHLEDPYIFFLKKYNSPYHNETDTYVLIDLL